MIIELLRRIKKKKQKCEKWSARSDVMSPLTKLSSRLLTMILSISEYELLICNLVGSWIVGVTFKLCKDKITFWTCLQL